MKLRYAVFALALSASATQVFTINEEFTGPGLPSSRGWRQYFGGYNSGRESSVVSVTGGMLELNSIGTDQQNYYYRFDLPGQRDIWQFETKLRFLKTEGDPASTQIFVDNSQFAVYFEIERGYVQLAIPKFGVGYYSYAYLGDSVWHTYAASGDKYGYRAFVNGVQIYRGGYREPVGNYPFGRLSFGDQANTADARWQMDYLRYSSQLNSPEPAWMGAAGLVLIAAGHFGRKR